MALRTISAFTGGYGLELGLELAWPGAFEPILYVEVDVQVAGFLAALMEEGLIPEAPVWSDMRTVTNARVRAYVRAATGSAEGKVDAITASYPCQDFSTAGKRKGLRGEKGKLWFSLAKAIRVYYPELVFLENVGGHLRRGFRRVRSDLRRMGYSVKAGLFTAEEVGASQKRERLFILAYCPGFGWRKGRTEAARAKRRSDVAECIGELAYRSGFAERKQGQQESAESRQDARQGSRGRGGDLAYGEVSKHEERQRKSRAKSAGSKPWSERCGGQLARSERTGIRKQPRRRRRPGRKGAAEPGGGESVLASFPLFPPRPDSLADWLDVLENEVGLAPAVGAEAEPAICRVADGLASRVGLARTSALGLLGNGCVVLQVAYAFRILAEAAGIEIGG